jgi:hypothetical protein
MIATSVVASMVRTGGGAGLIDNPENRARAEQYADWLENNLRNYGPSTEYFCDSQRKLWRQTAIDSFMGNAPVPEIFKEADSSSSIAKP